MIEHRSRLRLAQKAHLSRSIRGFALQKLQRDGTTQASVGRFINDTNPALAEQFQNCVRTELAADHALCLSMLPDQPVKIVAHASACSGELQLDVLKHRLKARAGTLKACATGYLISR